MVDKLTLIEYVFVSARTCERAIFLWQDYDEANGDDDARYDDKCDTDSTARWYYCLSLPY